MSIDVFTLFPEWFDWFPGQRHVAQRARRRARRLRCVNYREHTPLAAGRSTTRRSAAAPGMVLRVDVVDAALRARYGRRRARRAARVVALTAAGGMLDDALSTSSRASPR